MRACVCVHLCVQKMKTTGNKGKRQVVHSDKKTVLQIALLMRKKMGEVKN